MCNTSSTSTKPNTTQSTSPSHTTQPDPPSRHLNPAPFQNPSATSSAPSHPHKTPTKIGTHPARLKPLQKRKRNLKPPPCLRHKSETQNTHLSSKPRKLPKRKLACPAMRRAETKKRKEQPYQREALSTRPRQPPKQSWVGPTHTRQAGARNYAAQHAKKRTQQTRRHVRESPCGTRERGYVSKPK